MKHGRQPLASLGNWRHAKRNPAVLNGLLCSRDASRHSLFRSEKRTRDLGGGKATNRSQGKGNLGRCRQRWMAAHKEKDEAVVRRPWRIGRRREPLIR